MICELTGMEIANASMYDGSTGAAEAIMMAVRVTGRDDAVIARTVHPEYREVIATYAQHQEIPVTLKSGMRRMGAWIWLRWMRRLQRYGLRADSVAELLWDD